MNVHADCVFFLLFVFKLRARPGETDKQPNGQDL